MVELRPIRESDYRDLYAVAADPLIWEQHPTRDRYKEEEFKQFFKDAIESNGALVILDSISRAVIGSSRFHAFNDERRDVEIGWTFLARSHWGGKYNSAVKKLMLTHAFKYVDSVKFVIGSQNLRSRRAIEKIGGVHIDTRDDTGSGEKIIYEITAPAFVSGQ